MLTHAGDFPVREALPGVYHISDPLHVCVTLLVGERAALLLDTGYGLHDLPAALAQITDRPVTVVLSHGHHDHACGAAQFDAVYAAADEMPVLAHYTAPEMRKRVFSRAAAEGKVPAGLAESAYMSAGMGNVLPLEADTVFDLGGLTARVLPMPGHTPGSIGLYVPERALLCTGDNWNPTTWLFFPEAQPLFAYAEMMHTLPALPFAHVLAPHAARLIPGARLRRYIDGLNLRTFAQATPAPVAGYETISTCICRPEPETQLFFDGSRTHVTCP